MRRRPPARRPSVPSFAPVRRRKRRWMRSLVLVAIAVGTFMIIRSQPEASCDLGYRPALTDAASDRQVVGGVERVVIAKSPLPWGAAVSVTTRIWGDRRFERWQLTKRNYVECTFDPVRPVGTFLYSFMSREGITPLYFQSFSSQVPIDQSTAESWRAAFGGSREFETSRTDEALAWLRVFPELVVAVPFVVLAVWTRRRDRGI